MCKRQTAHIRLTNDLFLLHCERKSLQTRIFGFEDGCVEAVVVLSDAMLASSLLEKAARCRLTKWMITLFSFRGGTFRVSIFFS
jgi:hypothetical protein